MKRRLSKIALSLAVITPFLFFLPNHLAQAQQTTLEMQEHVDANSKDFTDNSSKLQLEGFGAWAAAVAMECVGAKTSNGEIITYGALPAATQYIAQLTTQPPVHTATYIADAMYNFGFAPQAYAQGIGFSALTPVLQIWKAFRNIAYFLFIIIFIAIGLMIMFQRQIEHQTVVTLQLALPKLVITLLLITFSYAIAGFVVDLIYLSIFFIISLLKLGNILDGTNLTLNTLFNYNIFSLGFSFFLGFGETAGAASSAVSALILQVADLPDWLSGISNVIAYLIIAVAIVIALFRTLFALVMAYINIIVSTIFAPLQLLMNAFPGSNTFQTWITSLIAHAAVFPAVATMVIIGAALVGGQGTAQLGITPNTSVGYAGNNVGWMPPLLGANSTGLNGVRGLIGLGIIMLLPETVRIIRELLGVKEGYGELAMQNFQRGTVVITRPFQAAQKTFNEYQQQLREVEIDPSKTMPPFNPRTQMRRFFGNLLGF